MSERLLQEMVNQYEMGIVVEQIVLQDVTPPDPVKPSWDEVNQAQQRSADLATQFERGVPGVELPQVMLEMQKASVSFRAITEVRNRFVNAYQEIMNMPI